MKNIAIAFLDTPEKVQLNWYPYIKHLGIELCYSLANEKELQDLPLSKEQEILLIRQSETTFFDLHLFVANARNSPLAKVGLVELVKNNGEPLYLLKNDYSVAQRKILPNYYLDAFQISGIFHFKNLSFVDERECGHYHAQASADSWKHFIKPRPALFLDRDGIINKDKKYLSSWDEVEIIPATLDLIREEQTRGHFICVLSNQSGVGRGFYREEDVGSLHSQMDKYLAGRGIKVDGWFYCPYILNSMSRDVSREGGYDYFSHLRKPLPGMVLAAEQRLTIDRFNSFMVGDKDSDRIQLPGLRSLLLKGNYPLQSDENVFSSLDEIRAYINSQ